MFGMDFEALVILAILAFILFGPEKLPEYAAKAGYYIAKLRQATTELQQQAQCSFPENLHQPAPPVAAISLTCPYCAHEVGQDFIFCPHCGHRVKEEEATAPAPPPSQPLAS